MLQELNPITQNLPSSERESNEIQNQKDLFIATLVHDFKNGLNAQLCCLNMFNEGKFGEINDKQKEIIEVVLESVNSLRTMSYSILNTYKYQNGAVTLNKKLTDTDKLLKTCISEVKSMADEKEISINYICQLNHHEKFLYIDAQQIRRVIANLLNNGINYSFKKSQYDIRLKKHGNKILFEFTNQSPTIDEEIKQQMFKNYTAGVKQFKTTGFGLGMYLSRKIIEAHQGNIYLNTKNNSNTFVFELENLKSVKNLKNTVSW